MEPQRVGFETPQSSKPKSDKIQYIALQKLNSNMNASEKKGAELWNVMVNWIRNHGGMEEK